MRLGRGVLVLVAGGLLMGGWVAAPLDGRAVQAAPIAQAQPKPSPSPDGERRREARPTPGTDELELRRLRQEVDLLDLQKDRLRQQMAIDEQPWRAPADAVAKVGPTLVGLGLLYLLARALAHWLPARPAEERAGEPYDEDEDEL